MLALGGDPSGTRLESWRSLGVFGLKVAKSANFLEENCGPLSVTTLSVMP